MSQSFVFPCYIKWGDLGVQHRQHPVRKTICVISASRIREKTRSLPDTGGLLSLPLGRGTGPATQEKGGQAGVVFAATFQAVLRRASPSSLGLCFHKVLLGCWREQTGQVSTPGKCHLIGISDTRPVVS